MEGDLHAGTGASHVTSLLGLGIAEIALVDMVFSSLLRVQRQLEKA